MTRTTLRHGLILLTAGIGASLGFIQSASAAHPAVLKIAPGFGGELEQNGGAGNEQPVVTIMNEGGKQYAVMVYMSSNVDQNKDGYWQCKCSSVLMDPTVGPVIVADQIQLTHNGGERPCNHPGIASDGTNVGVWGYGTNEANGRTRTYVQGINNKCELTTERLRISEDNDQDENAMSISYNANGYFTAGYLSNANNGKDAVYAAVLKQSVDAGTQKIEKMALTAVVAPSDIGRPAIVDAGPGKAFFCASKGNNRPPEQGVECALLDAVTGKVLYKEVVAASDPANNVYMNSPTVAKISDNTIAVQVIESNGNGRKSNKKGSNYSHLYAFKISGDSFAKAGFINGVGVYPTHSSICSGTYGLKGATYVGAIGLSPIGLGQPSMQFVSFNGSSFTADKKADLWTVGYYGDSGLVSNLYGANPNTQGRDYPICYGNVRNPGFGVKNGYMADVESFFLVPHAGNNLVEMKNAAYLSFVPGKVTQALEPQSPQEQPKKGITPPPGAEAPDLPETVVGEGAGSLDDGPVHVSGPGAAACSVPAPGSSSPANLAFLALGVGALFAARRRR